MATPLLGITCVITDLWHVFTNWPVTLEELDEWNSTRSDSSATCRAGTAPAVPAVPVLKLVPWRRLVALNDCKGKWKWTISWIRRLHTSPHAPPPSTPALGCTSRLKSIWACRIKSVFAGAVEATVKPVYTIQPVVKPVVKPVCQPVVSCIQPVVKSVVQPGLTTGWTNRGCSFNTVVKPIVKLSLWQPVVSCKRGKMRPMTEPRTLATCIQIW